MVNRVSLSERRRLVNTELAYRRMSRLDASGRREAVRAAREEAEAAQRTRAAGPPPPQVICRAVSRLGNRCSAEAVDTWAELPLCSRHGAEVIRSYVDRGIVTVNRAVAR
jgi:hypothetical protein